MLTVPIIVSVTSPSESEIDFSFVGGSLINVVAGENLVQYHGTGTPTTWRFYLRVPMVASDGTFVAKGSVNGKTRDFYQGGSCSLSNGSITLATGNLYSTVDSSDPSGQVADDIFGPSVLGDLVICGIYGEFLVKALSKVRIPTTPNPITWQEIRAYQP
jgi:hypothetical protein